MKQIKIYTQDHGVYGCIIVVANSKEEARIKMKDCENYNRRTEEIYEHDINTDFIYENLGDT